MANINKPSYIFRYHTDESGNLINVNVENSYQVSPVNNIVMLDQIPSETERLIIRGEGGQVLTECFNMDEITQSTYYCDYNEGKVYFDATHQGKTKIISYYGRGLALISADRVFLPDSLSNGDVVETLQDLIDFGKECLEAIKTLGSAVEIIKKLEKNIEDGNVLNTALENNIAIGTPLQASLNKDIKDALVFKDQLKVDVADGKVLNTQLNEIVNEGKILKPELDQSLANAQGVIDKVNSAGNKSYLISAEQWVANTDNTISSAFTYRLKHDINSENLQVNGLISGFSTIIPYKTLGVNEILLISDERVNMKVIINASYYNGGADIAEEVIDARKGKAKLVDKITELEEKDTSNKTELQTQIDVLNDFKANGGVIGGDITSKGTVTLSGVGKSKIQAPIDGWFGIQVSDSINPPQTLYYDVRGADKSFYSTLGNQFNLGRLETPWKDIHLSGVSRNNIGYSKLPNGMLLQWGWFETSTSPSGHLEYQGTFPIRFNKVFSTFANVNMIGGTTQYIAEFVTSVNYNEVNYVIKAKNLLAPSYGTNPIGINFIAIGY